MSKDTRIAIVGGTGNLGSAIAGRLAKAGYPVMLGSRNAQNAIDMAAHTGHGAKGASNIEAAAFGDIVIVTVPFAAQEATLREIAPMLSGKIVVDTTVPLVPPRVMRVQMPPEGSAAARAQAMLGGDVRLVAGFHNVAAHKLAQEIDIGCDVLVFGDDKQARSAVVELANDMGLRGLHAGALANAVAAEAMTSILIFMNKYYSVDGAGITISGALKIPQEG